MSPGNRNEVPAAAPNIVVLHHVSSWTSTVESATAMWPARYSVQPSGPATLEAWLCDEAITALLPPVDRGAITAAVIGREPMSAYGLTRWMHRTLRDELADDDLESGGDSSELSESSEHVMLPAGPAAVSDARDAIARLTVHHHRAAEIALMTSELVSNAVQHARGADGLRIHRSRASVTVEVDDADAGGMPIARRIPVRTASGRGLATVDALAAHWGVTLRHELKTVWFEVPSGIGGTDD